MSFNFMNLDADTRRLMLEEIGRANETGNIYSSTRFNEEGNKQWVPLLREAAAEHNEHWLAFQLEARWLMKQFEEAKKKLGGYTTKHVPNTASETMAEGQFNRFYMIAIARRAIEQGAKVVTVYRAKERAEHREESDELVGTALPAEQMVQDLRQVQASLKHALLRPNSGLSVRL